MPQDAADERQSNTACRPQARIGVPQVMDPDICDPRLAADALPLLVEAIKVSLPSLTGENPKLIAGGLLPLLLKDLKRGARERDNLRAGLAGCLPEHPELKVDLRPFQTFDLAPAGAGQDQQAENGDGRPGRGRAYRLVEDGAQTPKLLGGQVAMCCATIRMRSRIASRTDVPEPRRRCLT